MAAALSTPPLLSQYLGTGANDGINDGATNYQNTMDNDLGLVHVSTPLLLISALPLLCTAFLGHYFDLGLENAVIIAIARSFVQLTFLGWILHPIFVLGMEMSWLVGLYVLLMILIATNEAISRPKYTYPYQPLIIFLTMLLSITIVSAFTFVVVIRPTPLWNPQYVIPIIGMLMGNCINGVSLSMSNMSTQIMEGGRREVELCLSFGGTAWESAGRLAKEAIGVGITPTINSMNVIGLVSIPGMMTGQILGGAPVTEAARYQILIMWLIAICSLGTIIMNVFVISQVAFDRSEMLRIDRFIQIIKTNNDKGSNQNGGKGSGGCCQSIKKTIFKCIFCSGCCEKPKISGGKEIDIEKFDSKLGKQEAMVLLNDQQPISSSNYGTSSANSSYSSLSALNKIQFLSSEQSKCGDDDSSEPFLRIANLQFSVPRSHTKQQHSFWKAMVHSPQPKPQRILCDNLNTALKSGEVSIVRGPSGCGKSTLLRVIAGLTPVDDGDVFAAGLSLAECLGKADRKRINSRMSQWRQVVRYVTQYKVDIPGTPRDFILRVSSFETYFSSTISPPLSDLNPPSAGEMISQSLSYLKRWGMGDASNSDPDLEKHAHHGVDEPLHHSFLDTEWKNLSGGESQRTIIAIALASCPKVLLLDEATSGLDSTMERLVESSVVEYARKKGAAVLWVTHSEDLSERLLKL